MEFALIRPDVARRICRLPVFVLLTACSAVLIFARPAIAASEFVEESHVKLDGELLDALVALSTLYGSIKPNSPNEAAEFAKMYRGLQAIRKQRCAGVNVAAHCVASMVAASVDSKAGRMTENDAMVRHFMVTGFVLCAAYGDKPIPPDLEITEEFRFDMKAIASDVYPLLRTGDPVAQHTAKYILKRFTYATLDDYDFSIFRPLLERDRDDPPLFLLREIRRRDQRGIPDTFVRLWPATGVERRILDDLDAASTDRRPRSAVQFKDRREKSASIAGELMKSQVWWVRSRGVSVIGGAFRGGSGLPEPLADILRGERHPLVLEGMSFLSSLDETEPPPSRQRGLQRARPPQRGVFVEQFELTKDPDGMVAARLHKGASARDVFNAFGLPTRATPMLDPTMWEYRAYRWDDRVRRRAHVASLIVRFEGSVVSSWELVLGPLETGSSTQ